MARQDKYNTFFVYIPTKTLHLVAASGYLLPVGDWNPLNLGHFLVPNSKDTLNPRPATRVGDVLPERSPVDHLAAVVETFVRSTHQRYGDDRDTSQSTELPDPTVDLDIYALPDQVRDRIFLHQRPNHFLRRHDLSHFTLANDTYVDEDEDGIARRYFSVGTKWLVCIDGRFINLCTDVQFKQFKYSFPELQSDNWYHVIKWYDDVVAYCSLFGIFVPSSVNVVKTSDSSYGFTCGHSPTDSAPEFISSKLHTWGQTIYQGINYAGFKQLPATSPLKSLLLNHHLQGFRLLHHILQRYHPLYNVEAEDYIVERPQQQFYCQASRHTIKLQMQEYFDKNQCYFKLEAYFNDSSKTLSDPTELRIFIQRCIGGHEIYQATRSDRANVDLQYKFAPHNLVQTLLLESRHLSAGRRPLDRDHSSSFDRSRSTPLRTSNTRRRPYGSGPPGSGILPQHQGEFLTKAINAVIANPQLGLVPDCICCKAMGVKAELRKHYFADCQFAKNNELCKLAFKNMCGILNSLSKKVPVSNDTSKTNRDLAINRLEAILDSPEDQLEDADIESDDDSAASSPADFCSGDESVHDSFSQH